MQLNLLQPKVLHVAVVPSVHEQMQANGEHPGGEEQCPDVEDKKEHKEYHQDYFSKSVTMVHLTYRPWSAFQLEIHCCASSLYSVLLKSLLQVYRIMVWCRLYTRIPYTVCCILTMKSMPNLYGKDTAWNAIDCNCAALLPLFGSFEDIQDH